MSKFGMDDKKHLHERVHDETVAHDHVPGRAYEVSNAADKLIHVIGGGLFNEPRYYDTNRSYADFCKEWLANGGKITSRILDAMGLTEQARQVIEAMNAVAESDTPEDLLIIAAWARDKKNGLKLRTTPQIALTLAAANKRTQPFVRKYSAAIMDRVDEVRQVFAAFRHLFQQTSKEDRASLAKKHGSLPHSLRKGIAEVLAETSPYELLKYNSEEHPTLKDVLLMVGGSKKLPRRRREGWPISKAMFEYIVNGKVLPDAPEIIVLRDKFFKMKNLSEVTQEILDKAGLTWENITSKFGSSKEVWELCIPLMGEMALTRNLRNFEQAGISKATWDKVYEKCANIVDTVQLPFRFFAAEREASSTEAKTLVSVQLDKSCQNVPELPGVTVILSDNSGSAVGAVISTKSKLRVSDAGNTLAAIIAKRMGRNAIVGVFGDSLIWVPFAANDSCLTIKKKIDAFAQTEDRSLHDPLAITPEFKVGQGVGGGTETGLWCAIHDLTERGVKVDRWILCSDLCCYTQGDVNCGNHMSSYFGNGGDKATVQSMLDKYRQKVNPDCYVYSINLNGHSQSQVRPNGQRTHLLSGWSEQIFGIVRDIEGRQEQTSQQKKVEIPTIALLRSKYKKN